MVTLNISGVTCHYGSVKILEDVTFSVKGGDFVGILGPNGSGKTTLLRAISKTLKPRIGTIFLDEVDVYSLKNVEVARTMAVVPQDTSLAFDFTALEAVLMGRNPHLSRFKFEDEQDLAVAREAMELTSTWHLADKLLSQLSGGEKQRVIIARALAQEPKILLLDEPTTHLDICHQIEIMDLLRRLSQQRKLVVLAVFHDFNLAAKYCDSVVLLKDGKIFSIGSMKDVLTGENIKKVYGVNVLVQTHPVTGSIYVMPVSTSRPEAKQPRRLKVHVICGGGSGVSLLNSLVDHRFNVTAGVLNLLDSDHEVADMLKVPVVGEAPFSPITEKAQAANLEMVEKADVVVLTDVPFGYANMKNLEAVKWALEHGKLIIMIEDTPIKERDFTGGKAEELWRELKNGGATTVSSVEEALCRLDEFEKVKD
ncbi:ABC transporter ATP-binding protein [Candidatus Hecatella orcuttiae]|uniref:ABC transporter ATP-binding protein n=1 Tax=Candidatus Hecatella orcuttiae TaxID=1935119 RepID=UPI002867B883|nr:ABC transporter ATP-binding protein [Candidatus Hecatella orcuttiae]